MSTNQDDYEALKEVAPAERWPWLLERAPSELRGHWWLGLIECAEFDASPARRLSTEEARANLEFAVALIDMAQRDGMPPYYAASRLARLVSALLNSGQCLDGVPAKLEPDNLARRILATFKLTKEQAIAVAERIYSRPIDEPGDAESDALRDMNWVLPDLQILAPHISDPALADEAREWIGIRGVLSGP